MRLAQGLAVSLLLHGCLVFGGRGYLVWERTHAGTVMEIDLAHSSLLWRPRGVSGARRFSLPSQPWFLAAPGKKPVSTPGPRPVSRVEPAEESAAARGEPAAEMPAETYLPAAAAARVPEWVEGMITEEDYPPAARKQGREARVVALVCIDPEGRVKEVRISEGGDPEFNQLVLERLRQARFRPAQDQDGNPVAVRMSLPIVFELH